MITPKDPRWNEFADRLSGPEGCNFRKGEDGQAVWRCGGGREQSYAHKILTSMGLSTEEVDETLAWCREHGGHCDCEIIFNCDPG